MDINEIKASVDDVSDAKINAPVPGEAKVELTDAEITQIIKVYIETGEIKREYRSPHGLCVKLRVPSQEILMGAVAETDKEIYADEEHISLDRAQMIRANNVLAAYIEGFGDKDYRSIQADKFDTIEGLVERKKMIYGPGGLNMFSTQWALSKLDLFQAEVATAFDAESLKNS